MQNLVVALVATLFMVGGSLAQQHSNEELVRSVIEAVKANSWDDSATVDDIIDDVVSSVKCPWLLERKSKLDATVSKISTSVQATELALLKEILAEGLEAEKKECAAAAEDEEATDNDFEDSEPYYSEFDEDINRAEGEQLENDINDSDIEDYNLDEFEEYTPENFGDTELFDEYQPDQFDEYQPDQFDEYQPDQFDEYQPDQFDEYQPDQFDEYQPDQLDEYQPDQFDEYQPDRFDEYQPDEFDEYQPDEFDEYQPDRFDDYQPEQLDEYQPDQFDEYQPDQFDEYQPDQFDEYQPDEFDEYQDQYTLESDSLDNVHETDGDLDDEDDEDDMDMAVLSDDMSMDHGVMWDYAKSKGDALRKKWNSMSWEDFKKNLKWDDLKKYGDKLSYYLKDAKWSDILDQRNKWIDDKWADVIKSGEDIRKIIKDADWERLQKYRDSLISKWKKEEKSKDETANDKKEEQLAEVENIQADNAYNVFSADEDLYTSYGALPARVVEETGGMFSAPPSDDTKTATPSRRTRTYWRLKKRLTPEEFEAFQKMTREERKNFREELRKKEEESLRQKMKKRGMTDEEIAAKLAKRRANREAFKKMTREERIQFKKNMHKKRAEKKAELKRKRREQKVRNAMKKRGLTPEEIETKMVEYRERREALKNMTKEERVKYWEERRKKRKAEKALKPKTENAASMEELDQQSMDMYYSDDIDENSSFGNDVEEVDVDYTDFTSSDEQVPATPPRKAPKPARRPRRRNNDWKKGLTAEEIQAKLAERKAKREEFRRKREEWKKNRNDKDWMKKRAEKKKRWQQKKERQEKETELMEDEEMGMNEVSDDRYASYGEVFEDPVQSYVRGEKINLLIRLRKERRDAYNKGGFAAWKKVMEEQKKKRITALKDWKKKWEERKRQMEEKKIKLDEKKLVDGADDVDDGIWVEEPEDDYMHSNY